MITGIHGHHNGHKHRCRTALLLLSLLLSFSRLYLWLANFCLCIWRCWSFLRRLWKCDCVLRRCLLGVFRVLQSYSCRHSVRHPFKLICFNSSLCSLIVSSWRLLPIIAPLLLLLLLLIKLLWLLLLLLMIRLLWLLLLMIRLL